MTDLQDPPPGLGRMRRLSAGVLWFERVWPRVAPALGLIGVLAFVALLDLPRMLPPVVHLAALALAGLGVLALLGLGLRTVRRPQASEADRRLEADSGLRHQPLAVLQDRPAAGGDALWAAHVARARAQLGRLRLRAPRPMLAAVDRQAWRALVLLGVAVGVGVAGPDALPRLRRAVTPGFVAPPAPPAPLLQAWITSPAYTGLAPMFLKPEGGPVTAPAGAVLSVSLTGVSGGGEPSLEQAGQSRSFATLDPTSFQIEQGLAAGGRIAVRRQGRDVAAWDLTLVADAAPVVLFPEPPGFLGRGTNPQTRLPWQVSHAYGVTALQAELHLAARTAAPPLLVAIPLPGNAPKTAKGARVQDLTAHPWAGLAVTAQLVARDAPGREGRSETAGFTLPERRFMNQLARDVIAVRRQLSLTPEARDLALVELDRLSGLPKTWDDDTAGYLNLRAIASLLYRARDSAVVPEAQARLWDLALHLEEGAPERTAAALEAARQELHDALEAEKQGDKVESAELDRRIKELQEALQKRLDALTDQARRDPDANAYNPETHPLDQRDMQKLAEQMRDAAKKGENDKARDKLAELEKMMEALKQGRPEHGEMTERERQRAEKRQRGAQQMSALQDMIQREGEILDHAQARAGGSDPRRPPMASAGDAAQRGVDERIQRALRRATGEVMQQYADLTGEVPPNLGDADAAMRDGAQALGLTQDGLAAGAAQRAIEALQKGGKSMQQQMARQFGRGQQGDQGDQGDEGDEGDDAMAQGEGEGDGSGPGEGRPQFGDRQGNAPGRPGTNRQQAGRSRGEQRDPLGRSLGQGIAGSDESGDVQVPEKMEEARTRALQDELRRRGADRNRSPQELEYIERLLRQF